MRFLKLSERKYFSPPQGKVRVSILTGNTMQPDGFEKHTVAIVKIPPGEKLDQHFHKQREESYLVLSGLGRAIVDGQEIKRGPGDLISVLPGEKHQLIADVSGPFEYASITAPAWVKEDVNV